MQSSDASNRWACESATYCHDLERMQRKETKGKKAIAFGDMRVIGTHFGGVLKLGLD